MSRRPFAWVAERQSLEAEAAAWLAVFRGDEPAVTFEAATRKPKL